MSNPYRALEERRWPKSKNNRIILKKYRKGDNHCELLWYAAKVWIFMPLIRRTINV
jgi:hypothetical protein